MRINRCFILYLIITEPQLSRILALLSLYYSSLFLYLAYTLLIQHFTACLIGELIWKTTDSAFTNTTLFHLLYLQNHSLYTFFNTILNLHCLHATLQKYK